jgi:3'(2'), 5'-bisphosphate nucleotidase
MYEEHIKLVKDLMKAAAIGVMKLYKTDFDYTLKDDDSPLTKADMYAHNILFEGLKETGYGILSEEAENFNVDNEYVWVIDPLDGTKDFIQRTGEFSHMVGLLKNGKPVLGVVYAPAIDIMYYGIVGEGCWKEKGEKVSEIRVTDIDDKSQFRFVISRNHFRKQDKDALDELGITEFKKMGSVGVKFSRIADGKAELCLYTTGFLGLWDCCAPHAIVLSAGGDVFDKFGNELVYDFEGRTMVNGIVGTNGKCKDQIIEAIKKGL